MKSCFCLELVSFCEHLWNIPPHSDESCLAATGLDSKTPCLQSAFLSEITVGSSWKFFFLILICHIVNEGSGIFEFAVIGGYR